MPDFPMRQVHLDFHTSPEIPDVGADWDPERFVATLKRARVDSVTLFACCHHGMCYYPSRVAPVHPALSFDLLGAQIDACHRAGIRCPVYLTVAWNVSAAQRHPEWRQVDVTGKQVGASPLEPGWPWLCVNNAYADELLAQTTELLDAYEIDGFFYDIVMSHPDGCVCENCLRTLRAGGLDPADPLHRRQNNHAVSRQFMRRVNDLVHGRNPDATLFFNSRWGLHFVDEAELYSQVEIESLPTGGWGYGFYPLWSRYARHFGKPMLGMTGRFHRTWADWGGLKHPDALTFECGGILATGGAVSIGDQLHPRGTLNEAVYDVIGAAFAHVERVEEFCVGATPVVEAGILLLDPGADKANQMSAGVKTTVSEHAEGAAKMLQELHLQFDVLTDRSCPDFSRYPLLIIPDRATASAETIQRLRDFVAGGGRLLLTHDALIDRLSDLIGIEAAGPAASVPDYILVDGFPYSLYEGPTVKAAALPGTRVLYEALPSYFNRSARQFSSHGFTPPDLTAPRYPAVTLRGNVAWFWGPVFTSYHRHGAPIWRKLLGEAIDRLLGKRLLETNAPPTAEVTLMRQSGRQIVHVVNYSPQRRSPGHVEILGAPVPLRDIQVTLNRPDGPVTQTIARVDSHAVLVFEGGAA